MEKTSSRPLAVESFSDSWLSNARPSLIDIIENEEEITTNSFDFDTPICSSQQSHHVHVVHADEIFSNGQIKPIFTKQSSETTTTGFVEISSYVVSSPIESRVKNRVVESDVQSGCSCCFRSRRRFLHEKILQRLFGYIGRTRRCNKSKKSSTKVDDIDRRTMEIKSFNNSPQTSPSPRTYYDVESSIQEAVLHCKRSIGR